MSAGAKAGLSILGIFSAALLGVCLYLFVKLRKATADSEQQDGPSRQVLSGSSVLEEAQRLEKQNLNAGKPGSDELRDVDLKD